jgi:hypothetical protein
MTKKNSKASEEKDTKKKDEDIDPADLEDDTEDLEDESVEDDEVEDLEDDSEEEEGDEESTDNEIDVDEELEEEKKLGKPDSKKAHKRIKDKEAEDDEGDEEEDEDDKPLSRKEARELLARNAREAQETRAYDLARKLTGSDKEAELVVMKWRNRTFPENLPLPLQIEEAYAITHRKRFISQRNEALRALKNRTGVKNDSTTTHRDGHSSPSKLKPKMSPQDLAAIEATGFKWVPKNGRFEKKLKNGNLLMKYPGKDIEKSSS